MSLIKRMRKQRAVFWERSDEPDEYGKFSYSSPIEIRCRWDESGIEYRSPTGQTVISQAVVYVDRIMKIGDMLREGEIESDEPDDPTEAEAAYEIQRFDKTPNIKATETLLTAYL